MAAGGTVIQSRHGSQSRAGFKTKPDYGTSVSLRHGCICWIWRLQHEIHRGTLNFQEGSKWTDHDRWDDLVLDFQEPPPPPPRMGYVYL